MARDCVALMRALGHERFAVAGHDRGAYVAGRTALDHPVVVTALVVMDAVPVGAALARCDATFALSWWHWLPIWRDWMTDLRAARSTAATAWPRRRPSSWAPS